MASHLEALGIILSTGLQFGVWQDIPQNYDIDPASYSAQVLFEMKSWQNSFLGTVHVGGTYKSLSGIYTDASDDTLVSQSFCGTLQSLHNLTDKVKFINQGDIGLGYNVQRSQLDQTGRSVTFNPFITKSPSGASNLFTKSIDIIKNTPFVIEARSGVSYPVTEGMDVLGNIGLMWGPFFTRLDVGLSVMGYL